MKRPIRLLHIYILPPVTLALFLAFSGSLSAQEKTSPTVYLKGAEFVPAPNASQWIDSIATSKITAPIQVLIQFSSIPTQQQRDLMHENGIVLKDYIPDNAFIAIIQSPKNLNNISSLPIRNISMVKADWKADMYTWQKINENISKTVEILVSFHSDIDKQAACTFIQQAGGQVMQGNMEDFGSYKVLIPANKVKSMAQWYGVKYISPVSKNALLDIDAKAAARVNVIAQPYALGGYNLLGDSVTIGVGDNTSGCYHADMVDRVINYNPAAITNHGIHINGIVGSAGILDPLAEGTAWHAKLVDHYFDNILTYTGDMNRVHNMTITNNSYVVIESDCSYAGTYDAYSELVDNLSEQYKMVLHVFAAGNDGNLTCNPYPMPYATTCGGYQPAKNSICVTGTDESYNNDITSRGPVKDGRMKPDLSNVSAAVYSCIGTTGYEYAGGTSMASPATAADAALLEQRYKQLHGGANARADVLKTLLLNGAMDIGNPGPDYHYGFGFPDMNHSLGMLNNNNYSTNVVTNGGLKTSTITVPANTAQLKVMLYWHDVAPGLQSSKALVNDLDLLVKGPDSITHKPLVLDPTPANVANNAVEGVDHLNNCEQVTINNPVAGGYTISVSGYSVPSLIQDYVIAYDFVPVGIKLTYPIAGSVFPNWLNVGIRWEASSDTNTFTLQYSTDNGISWTVLSNNVPSTQRSWGWSAPINSGQCLMKLSRNNTNQQSISGPFTMNKITAHLDSVQCPGYMSIYWDSVPNATAYQVWRKIGPYMHVVDTVSTSNTYVFSGLSPDSTYYAAVAPIINGSAGYRSLGLSRQPNTGNCAGNYSNGDLTIEKILAPTSGRKLTSIQLGNSENLVLRVRNLYTSTCIGYSISYKVNNGSWQTAYPLVQLPANSETDITVAAGLNLSNTGNYKITVAITNVLVTDPVHQNDTLVENITQFVNNAIDLTNPYTDGFESIGVTTKTSNYIGISSYWDFATNNDSGRIRTYVNDSILITGNRSVSLDDIVNFSNGDGVSIAPANQNYFTGTFNMSNYSATNTEIRMSFDYIMHGIPRTDSGNHIWVHGIDTAQWVDVFKYNMSATPGQLNHSGSISLSDAMLQHLQNFSTSTQIRFGQNDTSLIGMRNYGNGITLDNFSIYTVQNDVGLISILNPQLVNCGLGTNVPLTVEVRNGVNIPQNNILLFYQLDNGTVFADTIYTLGPKDSLNYTFKEKMNLSSLGAHVLNVWLSNTGDTYHANDSILNFTFHNQPLVNSFPYLENFETSNGNWYTDGINDTWQYGTPSSPKIHKAASGSKAWKTNLTGTYKDLGMAYLYSPCFDLSEITHPMLSFSFAMEIENCGDVLCDAGYMEYSYDGTVWTKLGATGQGTNWYDSTFNVWNELGNTRWHVASIPLPASTSPIRLRFVLASDPGAHFEGMAVDDIHIFDLTYPIYNGNTIYTNVQNATGTQWLDFTQAGGIMGQVQPDNQNLGTLTTTIYTHSILSNQDQTQAIFPKSFTVKTTQAPTDSVGLRLYVLDSDVLVMIHDTNCISCTKPEDAYSLGITKYDNTIKSLENGILSDNTGGNYMYYPYKAVKWVPYDKGYYAEINVASFSELWLNDGGPTANFPLNNDYLLFNARKINPQDVKVDWTSYIDTSVNYYRVQRSLNDTTFIGIDSINALHQASPQYIYTDMPAVAIGSSVYYRLQWYGLNDSVYYSPVRKVDWTNPNELINIYPNPTNGLLHMNWTANTGTALRLSVTDAIGKIVYQTNITATEWNMSSTIQTPHFSSGIYFMRIAIGDKQYLQKLLYY